MKITRTSTRSVQFGLLILLVICAAQVGWWILDQWLYMQELSSLAGDGSELAAAIDRDRRMNRYLWEGAFFLIVLLVGMGVLARALRREAQLRYRQQVFLASVSHELRSPLATCRAAAETLRLRDPTPKERERLVGRVLRNLRRLEEMVVNLLDAARIEDGRLALEPEPIDVAEALDRLVAEHLDRAEDAGVRIELDTQPALALETDPHAFRTILRNLIGNAIKASGVEDDERTGEPPVVTIRAERHDGGIRVAVGDRGHGFDPEDRERLFERFWRPGDEMRRGGRGAGLGLYIARALADESGATLEAFSEGLGKGARFELVWPASPGGRS